nr:ATP-binding protein [Bacilli bacterium]
MKHEKKFKTESQQLLDLMINSIYSEKEIFLRELLSNASDAIDKYRYLSLTDNEHYPSRDHFIRITPDEKERTITIVDNGIGMDEKGLEDNLGTIAKSGSKEFMEKFKEAKEKEDLSIIGQFGVGFYSLFMVGKSVEVISKTIDQEAHRFYSEGKSSYTIEDLPDYKEVGTKIIVHLKDDT